MDSISSRRSLVESYRTIRCTLRRRNNIFGNPPRSSARGEIALIFVDFRLPRVPDEKTPPSGLGWIRPLFARSIGIFPEGETGKKSGVILREMWGSRKISKRSHTRAESRSATLLRFPRLISFPAVLRGGAGRGELKYLWAFIFLYQLLDGATLTLPLGSGF